MQLKYTSLMALLIGTTLLSVNSLCEPLDLDLTPFIDISYDENPLRVSESSADFVDGERKDTAGLNLSLNQSSATSLIDLDYRVVRDEFEKDSQEDETAYSGSSLLSFGTETSSYGIDLSHRVTRALNAPDAAAINLNVNEVSSYSVQPRLSNKPTSNTRASIYGLYTRIDYEDNEFRFDTEQKGVQFTIDRLLSGQHRVFLDVASSTTRFDGGELLDYDYRRMGLGFARETERLDYRFQVGSNRISPKNSGDDESGTFVSTSLNFDAPNFDIEASYQSELTASSIVGSLDDGTTNMVVQGVNGDEDRVRYESFDFTFNYSTLCVRCDLTLALSEQKIKNLNFSENDTNIKLASISLTYILNRTTRLVGGITERESRFTNDPARDTESTLYQLSAEKRVSQSITLGAYASNEDFSSGDRAYDSLIVGIRVNADLY